MVNVSQNWIKGILILYVVTSGFFLGTAVYLARVQTSHSIGEQGHPILTGRLEELKQELKSTRFQELWKDFQQIEHRVSDLEIEVWQSKVSAQKE